MELSRALQREMDRGREPAARRSFRLRLPKLSETFQPFTMFRDMIRLAQSHPRSAPTIALPDGDVPDDIQRPRMLALQRVFQEHDPSADAPVKEERPPVDRREAHDAKMAKRLENRLLNNRLFIFIGQLTEREFVALLVLLAFVSSAAVYLVLGLLP